VTAKFDPAQINIADTTPATVKVDVSVASDAEASNSVPLAIKAVSGEINASANLGLAIPAELLITIQPGVAIGTAAEPNKAAFGAYGMPVYQVAAGTKVTWINMDTSNHEIHSNGGLGIAHENGPLMANGANSYTQTINGKSGDVFTYRCHLHPNMLGQFVIK
jgi:plastocyanin